MSGEELGIAMPHNLEAEQAVLGAILLDEEALLAATERLTGESFYQHTHGVIFDAMIEMSESNVPIDLVTLVEKLNGAGKLEDVGGVAYIADMAKSVPTAANVEHYAGIVAEKYALRRAIAESQGFVQEAAAGGDAAGIVAKMQEAAAALALQASPKKPFRAARDVAMAAYEGLETRVTHYQSGDGEITGIPSGYTDLDRMTSGFQRSDLIIVAARPSVGKTAFALNIAQNVGIRSNEPVAIFSLEMGAEQLMNRMISAEANVDASRLRTGGLQGDDWEKITQALGRLASAPIYIDDNGSQTVYDIRAKSRRLQQEKGLGLVLIDYLQLLTGRRRQNGNRQEEVSEISRTLKQMARELNVPVIALSQLSRGVEQRQDKRPMMSDLRESGSIEQDADIVAFLYRDDYYSKESEKKGVIEIIIAKQRNGPVGTVELAFLKNFNKFISLDRTHQEAASRSHREPDPRRQWA